MHKLPTRCNDGIWEVLIPNGVTEKWTRCRTETDARLMAASGSLAFDALEGVRTGDEIGQELEQCAELFSRYECNERAIWIREHAKFARGKPSLFDQ